MEQQNNAFGELLTTLRKEKGYTQQKLGEEFGVGHNTISKWEQGKLVPDAEMLMKISYYFNILIDLLLKGQRYQTSVKTNDTIKELLRMDRVYKYYQD